VDSTGTHPEDVILDYANIPSASSYDWSSLPGGDFSKAPHAVWSETVVPGGPLGGVAVARVATGVNSTAQANDSISTLAAGVLLGIAGGALVAALQEGLHG